MDERDEWVDSMKMVMLQELNIKTKKQMAKEKRAKASGKEVTEQHVSGVTQSMCTWWQPLALIDVGTGLVDGHGQIWYS